VGYDTEAWRVLDKRGGVGYDTLPRKDAAEDEDKAHVHGKEHHRDRECGAESE
jgi:hypothetical protein